MIQYLEQKVAMWVHVKICFFGSKNCYMGELENLFFWYHVKPRVRASRFVLLVPIYSLGGELE